MNIIKKRKFQEVLELCEEIGLKCISTKYETVKSNMLFECPQCNEVFERNFDNLKTRRNPLCALCGRRNSSKERAHTITEVRSYIEEESGSGCLLISKEYKNVDSLLDVLCSCGKPYKVSFYKFKARDEFRCKDCTQRLIAERLLTPIEKVKELVESQGYILINRNHDFDTGEHVITVVCDKGHEEYDVSYHKFRHGRRCPRCSNSLGEKRVQKFLEDRRIQYESEFRFDELRGIGGSHLRFDFAVFRDKEIVMLIEYDGIHHFEPVEAFGGLEYFERVITHDKMKNEFCRKREITLVRIPYWDYEKIECIVENALKERSM